MAIKGHKQLLLPCHTAADSSVNQAGSAGPKRQSSLKPLSILALLFGAVIIGRAFFATHAKLKSSAQDIFQKTSSLNKCEEKCRPSGTEALPKGLVASTSDLEMRPLWGSPIEKKSDTGLLAMAVGKRQKDNVDKIVRKFLVSDFVVMLFHYDGNVDDWKDLEWSAHALHVAAANQTKWWFAKRFLHPDIVAKYSYIFLWDEDLGVENFNIQSYLSVIKQEGLEISQPAIDLNKSSEIHHQITVRQMEGPVHRRVNGSVEIVNCDESSVGAPCTGWVEMMAPVFSRAAWRCTWYMIQNDLVFGWGLDFQFGYCAQGDRTRNIGVVDSDYVIHYGVKTLGGAAENKTDAKASPGVGSSYLKNSSQRAASNSTEQDIRSEVLKHSFAELKTFKNRWKKAVEDDDCWTDMFPQPKKQSS